MRRQVERARQTLQPSQVALRYRDPARSYQTSLQQAGVLRPGRSVQLETPFVLSADRALAICNRVLARGQEDTARWRLSLPLHIRGLGPGALITLPDGQVLAVDRMQRDGLLLHLDAHPVSPARTLAPTDPGRHVAGILPVPGDTIAHIFELPTGDAGATTALARVAAAGTGPDWRRASLFISTDGGISHAVAAELGGPATLGVTAGEMVTADPFVWDDRSVLLVDLLTEAMTLDSRPDIAILSGANRLLVGDEVIQFARAERIGTVRWRLTRLLRGRSATEALVHGPGERVVLSDGPGVTAVPIPIDRIGQPLGFRVVHKAQGFDEVADEAVTPVGLSLQPLAPVHVRGDRLVDGTLTIQWQRQTRIDNRWRDQQDSPLGETEERYRLSILSGGMTVRSVDTTSAGWTYGIAEQIADQGAAGQPVSLVIRQLSDLVGPGQPWSGIL